jgi:hypothetical protein
MQWVVAASENLRLKEVAGNLYPLLHSDEALLEGAVLSLQGTTAEYGRRGWLLRC